jgi:hypothetical protein
MSNVVGVAKSVNGVSIRLTEERWQHIIEGHVDLANYLDDVLQVVERPDTVFEGRRGLADCGPKLWPPWTHSAPIHQSELSDDDFLIEYDANRNIVGVTILDASSR